MDDIGIPTAVGCIVAVGGMLWTRHVASTIGRHFYEVLFALASGHAELVEHDGRYWLRCDGRADMDIRKFLRYKG